MIAIPIRIDLSLPLGFVFRTLIADAPSYNGFNVIHEFPGRKNPVYKGSVSQGAIRLYGPLHEKEYRSYLSIHYLEDINSRYFKEMFQKGEILLLNSIEFKQFVCAYDELLNRKNDLKEILPSSNKLVRTCEISDEFVKQGLESFRPVQEPYAF